MKNLLIILLLLLPGTHWAQVNFTDSDLPIIAINTGGQSIPNDPKITADMKVFFNGSGKRNKTTDPPTAYNNKIGIELRGQSSQGQPLRSYDIELRDPAGVELNAPLLGMAPESDWVLYAPYMDKTLMRNFLAYTLSRRMGRWASDVRYVELVLNNEYQGIYLLVEKIKRNSSRVNIADLLPTDNAGIELTGGYIFSLDKQPNGWFSSYPSPSTTTNATRQFSYVYPRLRVITPQQKEYLKNTVDEFERALAGPQFQDPGQGVRKHANLSSFIDFFIINEISKNIDGYRLSTYLYKDKNVKDGRIHAGPVWDFDLGFKNADYCAGNQIFGWGYRFNFVCPSDGAGAVPFWWERLTIDTGFLSLLRCRWVSLRTGILSDDAVDRLIDSADRVTTEARARHFSKWDLRGTTWWRGQFPIQGYEAERETMRAWIKARMNWLDQNIQNTGACGDWPSNNAENIIISTFPNPFKGSGFLFIKSRESQGVTVEVVNSVGRTIMRTTKNVFKGDNKISMNGDYWPAGVYQIMVTAATGEKSVFRLIKQ